MAKQLNVMLCLIFSLSSLATTSVEDHGKSIHTFLDSQDSERLYANLKGPTHSYETSDQKVGIYCSLPKERDLGPPLCYAVLKMEDEGKTEITRDENILRANLDSADASGLFNALDFTGLITRYGEEKYFRSSDVRFSVDCRQQWHIPFAPSSPKCTIYVRLKADDNL